MNVKFFKGLQDYLNIPRMSSNSKPIKFNQAVMLVAKNKTRRHMIAEYVISTEGSCVILCPTNDMCETIANAIPNALLCNSTMNTAERLAALDTYTENGSSGTLVITIPGFVSMVMQDKVLHTVQNLIFASYSLFSKHMSLVIETLNPETLHQIVDNVSIRGVIPRAYRELGELMSLTYLNDYKDFNNFER